MANILIYLNLKKILVKYIQKYKYLLDFEAMNIFRYSFVRRKEKYLSHTGLGWFGCSDVACLPLTWWRPARPSVWAWSRHLPHARTPVSSSCSSPRSRSPSSEAFAGMAWRGKCISSFLTSLPLLSSKFLSSLHHCILLFFPNTPRVKPKPSPLFTNI